MNPAADNPFFANVDGRATALIADLLGVAARYQRLVLVNLVGMDVPIGVQDTEALTLADLQDRVMEEQLRLLCKIRLDPAGLCGVFALDSTLLSRLMGLLLGEDPWGEPTPADPRPLTAADERIGRRILEALIDGLNRALPDGPHRFELLTVDDDPRLDIGLPFSTPMLQTVLDVGDPDSPMGMAMIAVPAAMAHALWPENPRRHGDNQAGVNRVLPLQVDAVAELARVKVPLSRLREFQVGDVIPLGAIRDIEVRVQGRKALVVEPGQRDGSRCVRVLRNVHQLESA